MLNKMSKKERVLTTLNHGETDRTPVYDVFFHDDCIEFFTGKRAPVGEEGVRLKCRAMSHMLDMTRAADVTPRVPGEREDSEGFVFMEDRWLEMGIVKRPFEDETGATEWLKRKVEAMQSELSSMNPAAEARAYLERFRQIQSYFEDDTVVLIRQSGTGLDDLRHLLGWEYFAILSMDEPCLISRYLELHTNKEVALIHEIADRELSPCALTYGDIAMKGTLLHSPDWLKKEFFPHLKKLNDAYHEHDIKCLFHSDGLLMPVMYDLLQTGIDGLNPIEVVAGMNLEEISQAFSCKLFLAGGIDMSHLLSYGTAEEVRIVCEKAITAAPKGYFIGSTSELDNTAKLENILMMLKTVGVDIKRI